MQNELSENNKLYQQKKELYKSFGYDIEKERIFVLEKAQPIFGKILEVGTGKGYFAIELAKEGYSFTSVDISEEDQKFARMNAQFLGLDKQINFRIEDARSLSPEDGTVDVLFSIHTIHHLDDPYKVIDEFIRCLSFEGKMVLSDFTEEGLELIERIHGHEGRTHHAGKVKLEDIKNYLLEKGFKVDMGRTKYQQVLIAYRITV